MIHTLKRYSLKAGEISQWVRTLTAKAWVPVQLNVHIELIGSMVIYASNTVTRPRDTGAC